MRERTWSFLGETDDGAQDQCEFTLYHAQTQPTKYVFQVAPEKEVQ
jgi:hypothetical protein